MRKRERERKTKSEFKNLNIIKKKEADKYYLRNIDYYNNDSDDIRLKNFLNLNLIKGKTILEIGCCNGKKLDQYRKYLKSSRTIGIDLSKKSISEGKKL
jgi:cyclopropane fatty-acyl-phospholipid synthase-like methyltransferase